MLPSHSSAGRSPGALPSGLALNPRLLAPGGVSPLPQPWARAAEGPDRPPWPSPATRCRCQGRSVPRQGPSRAQPSRPSSWPGKGGRRGMRAGLGPGPGRRSGHGAEGGRASRQGPGWLAGGMGEGRGRGASSINMITEHVLGPGGVKTNELQAGFIAMDAMC